jgi:septum formation protein
MPSEPVIYLASKSPRRQELLRQVGLAFVELRLREAAGRQPDIVEKPRRGESAQDYVRRVASAKAGIGWRRMRQRHVPLHPVLGADTEVALDGTIFGKPTDAGDAVRMLTLLSGRTHEVLTAIALQWRRRRIIAISTTRVTFRRLANAEIARYVATGESFDKAGGYAVQGLAAAFIRRIEGSYSGVMGLPLYETAQALAQAGFPML